MEPLALLFGHESAVEELILYSAKNTNEINDRLRL